MKIVRPSPIKIQTVYSTIFKDRRLISITLDWKSFFAAILIFQEIQSNVRLNGFSGGT